MYLGRWAGALDTYFQHFPFYCINNSVVITNNSPSIAPLPSRSIHKPHSALFLRVIPGSSETRSSTAGRYWTNGLGLDVYRLQKTVTEEPTYVTTTFESSNIEPGNSVIDNPH
jgi:hypothetical protein